MVPPLKFAVVREDPDLELALLQRFSLRRPLVVASGGCTALALMGADVDEVTAFDLNPTQLAHVERKRAARARGDTAALGVESTEGLHEIGAFEGLFRVLRRFCDEFVPGERTPERLSANPYWPAAFATTFNDAFLHAMFGPAATQHAAPGSYPGYFQRAFERGMARGGDNYFLDHVFRGAYRRQCAPPFVYATERAPLRLIEGTLLDVPHLERFDLFSLSNVFDWSDDRVVGAWADALQRAEAGAVLLLRQLNNGRDLRAFFPHFAFDDALSRELLARDRSLFYERIEVGVRR